MRCVALWSILLRCAALCSVVLRAVQYFAVLQTRVITGLSVWPSDPNISSYVPKNINC